MQYPRRNCTILLKRLLLLIIPYEITRVIFYIFNYHYFADVNIFKLLVYCIKGLRFDFSAIVYTNLLFIILSLLPVGREGGFYRKGLLSIVFLIVNGICMFTQMADTIFFRFVYKRSTFEIFKYLGLGDDTGNLAPLVVREYWYMLVVLIGLIYLIHWLYGKSQRIPSTPSNYSERGTIKALRTYFIVLIVLWLGLRGKWHKSLGMMDAADFAPVHDIPLVINSPFSIIKTIDDTGLQGYHFFKGDVPSIIYSPLHNNSKGEFKKLNIVVIIMESFSKEYVGAINNRHKTCTPFLDSLISCSLVFDNAFSDGKKSIEGIPAVLAGIPTWMDEPFIISKFGRDSLTSPVQLLKNKGYITAFFHGGNNGTMGFVDFTKKIGFSNYFGRQQYNNDKDYDGCWGIWDEQYFRYFGNKINTFKTPFFAAIFSLSSHHPYSIPTEYKNRFPREGNEMEILKCVRYSDMALRDFFKLVSKFAWYDSTLFVIVADHTGPSDDNYYSNRIGMYEIPIIFFAPNTGLKGKSDVTMQQIDIMPLVLDYIHYPQPYFSFGISPLDSSSHSHFAINYINNVYQIVRKPYCLQMEGTKITALYNYINDSSLSYNLVNDKPGIRDPLSDLMKGVIQTYSEELILNKIGIKKGSGLSRKGD